MSESDEFEADAEAEEEISPAHNGAIKILREVLRARKEAVDANPNLIRTDLLTQSGVYYETRPKLLAAGINPAKAGKRFRPNLTRKIELICEEMGVTREEIGIFAQARTFLYFRGEKHSVGFKDIESLMWRGTDLILIEKEGMAEVLRPYADMAGIAILNSIGFVARYASKLSQASEQNGSNIAMVTDFDVSGLSMARDLPWVYRIGIDFDTVDYFALDTADVEEEYDTSKPTKRSQKGTGYRHWKGLENMGPGEGEDPEEFKNNLEYLKTKRIEIDSIVRKVGNEAFWDFVVDKLTEKFPTRDYNRAIDVPNYVDPDVLRELAGALRGKIRAALEDNVQEKMGELSEYEGVFDDVGQEESDIEDEFQDLITTNTKLAPILSQMQKLVDKIKKIRMTGTG